MSQNEFATALRDALPGLPEKDQAFASNLLKGWERWHSFTDKQFYWVKRLLQQGGAKARTQLSGNLVPFAVMFQFAKQHLRRPKVRLITDEGTRFYVYPAAEKSKNAGWFYVKMSGLGGAYCGKIDPKSGEFIASADCTEDILRALHAFAADPKQAATAYGKLTNACCFCGQTLTDNVSVTLGYGPICAQHYGLPHHIEEQNHAA